MMEIFMLIVQIIVTAVLIIGSAYLTFMSSHIVSEKKAGHRIPLPWEKKKYKVFNKADIEYRDGDNT